MNAKLYEFPQFVSLWHGDEFSDCEVTNQQCNLLYVYAYHIESISSNKCYILILQYYIIHAEQCKNIYTTLLMIVNHCLCSEYITRWLTVIEKVT